MPKVYLGIGTNSGRRKKNIEVALRLLKKEKIKINQVSSFFKTRPEEGVKGSYFLNGVAEIETELKPKGLLRFLKEIEENLGRERNHKREEPRAIDLDIIFYGSLILNESDLIIPHPKFRKRRFVLEPLNEIAPSFNDPVTGKKIETLLKENCSARL
ncbi:MAG: 2-amino-4-hydroxy-6-hydroxymethyldihydropteridine diphosphokinase [Candidatus Omnitrophica bacterium]|nr:2-amino-4-hydroxy-6-hydroxymethyldihydropteridine diphosphokinase [Candidatus Omnitrophota bacterium]